MTEDLRIRRHTVHTLRLDWIRKPDTHGLERNGTAQYRTPNYAYGSCNHGPKNWARPEGWQAFARAVVRMLLLNRFQIHGSGFPTRNAQGHTFYGIYCMYSRYSS
jgi:hypothetical protein